MTKFRDKETVKEILNHMEDIEYGIEDEYEHNLNRLNVKREKLLKPIEEYRKEFINHFKNKIEKLSVGYGYYNKYTGEKETSEINFHDDYITLDWGDDNWSDTDEYSICYINYDELFGDFNE